jgi:cation diffusion facilitator family transporter
MVSATKLSQPGVTQKNMRPNQPAITQVLWQVLGINLVVATAKIIAGTAAGSISMVADGFHSIMDASSNVIGLIGSTIAGRPPDGNHPYGHQKYETFATLGIGLLLLLTSWNILKSVFARLVDGSKPEITGVSLAVMLTTILLNLMVVTYEKKKGHQLNSNLLLADAAHTKSDIFVSLSVLASLITVKMGWLWMDMAVVLLIIVVIGRTGWQIIRQASDVLADSAIVDAGLVEKIVLSIKGVQSCHKIRSRGTEQLAHLDLHIQVDGQMTLKEAHRLGHFTQDRLENRLGIADVLVHVEPMTVSNDQLDLQPQPRPALPS